MTATEEILTDLREGILTIRFNRPDKKNALNFSMYSALANELRQADENDAVRVVLLTGGEDCFTSGYDLADFMTARPTGADSPVMQFLAAINAIRKPLVAAVNGAAVGIGVTMLLHCELVYAAASAVFQMPFVNLGLCPEAGSTLLLPRMMGHQRAAELLLLGESFSAETAYVVGIVNMVFPDGDVYDNAWERASRLAAQPPAAVRLAKELLKQNYAAPLRETIAMEGEHFMTRLESPEAAEALDAFMQRRTPDFARFT